MHITTKDIVIVVVQAVFTVVVFGNIFSKAGFSRWFSVLLAVPIVNIITILWFSFTEWPIEQELVKAQFEASRLSAGHP
ncbi:MAG: hypothetical protein ROO76_17190 [Terriglobia bacterium]|jgi:hypothetical protein|nr:hypothetical protein [Terriglobia bacterium]